MRNYVRKSDRGNTPVDIFERAVDMVLKEERKITSVGKQFNIPRRSLRRYIDNQKKDTLSTMEIENTAEEGRPNPSSLKLKYVYSRSHQVTIKLSSACIVSQFSIVYIELITLNLLSSRFSQMNRRIF